MYPILFTLGPLDIHSHDALIALGVVVASLFFLKEARPAGLPWQDVMISLPLGLGVTFLCVYLSGIWIRYLTIGWVGLEVNGAYGTASFGMVLGVLLAGYLAARWRGMAVGVVLDRLALVLPLAQTFGRVGCFLEGCCYGLETGGFLRMYLPGEAGVWAYRYPTQLVLAAFDLGLFAWLWSRRARPGPDGCQAWLYLICFCLGRLAIDALRDLPRVWGPFNPHQLTSLAILLVIAWVALGTDRAVARRRVARS